MLDHSANGVGPEECDTCYIAFPFHRCFFIQTCQNQRLGRKAVEVHCAISLGNWGGPEGFDT